MQRCDALIVGAGPAGSSCAWKLAQAGLDVVLLDKRRFPREKICGGWVTPLVLRELNIDPSSYAPGRVLQPILGFRTGLIGGATVDTRYPRPVSYGVRRFEFDHFLLQRCGAQSLQGVSLESLRRDGNEWVVNDQVRAPIVVGAGGHFCPVARLLGARHSDETVVAAQEIEVELNVEQQAGCNVDAELPELYFCPDMKGYGWAFRKGNFLNIGLGRLDNVGLSKRVAAFVDWLKVRQKIPADTPSRMPGHAYLLHGVTPRNLVGDGMLLAGDAAGLAYAQSGEGIRPAIESGLLAAETILDAGGDYSRSSLESYQARLSARFGPRNRGWAPRLAALVSESTVASLAGMLLTLPWFCRHVLLERWFLHLHQPALDFKPT